MNPDETSDGIGDEKVHLSAADLLGTDVIAGNCMVQSVVIVITAVDMETGREELFVVEDDNTAPWKHHGMLATAHETYDFGADGLTSDEE